MSRSIETPNDEVGDSRLLLICCGVIAAGLAHALLQEQLIYAMPVRGAPQLATRPGLIFVSGAKGSVVGATHVA